MSFHFADFSALLAAVSAAVHTVEAIMPNSPGVAKADAAVSLVQALAPAIKTTADELKPVISAVCAVAKGPGGSLAPVSPVGISPPLVI
jgi:hypothetical protein